MKHYFDENGKELPDFPDPFRGVSPMHTPDGAPNEALFVELGGSIEDDGRQSPFEAACARFRELCAAIGAFIGDSEFRGGFDEYAVFAASDAYRADPVTGNSLAIRWSALNELCKYEGAKIGLDQPGWWYKCWELADCA